MSEHTPGPWHVQQLIPDGKVITNGPYWEVATPEYEVCGWVQRGAPIRNEADAHLIAAAPDLLEALIDAERAIASLPSDALGVGEDAWEMWLLRDELLEKIHDTLAKAKGDA